MIDWTKYFDRIYCIHFLPEESRLERISSELKRIGILDSGIFEWKETYVSPFYNVIRQNVNLKHEDLKKNQGGFNVAYMHYEIYKNAEGHKYKKILVLEEDAVFLKNLNSIEDLLINLPQDYDVVLFDKWCENPYKYIEDFKNHEYDCNPFYREFKHNSQRYCSSACYSLSMNAYTQFIKRQEQSFHCSDELWNNWGEEELKIKKYYSIVNMAYQKNFANSIHNNNFDVVYSWVGLNRELYT